MIANPLPSQILEKKLVATHLVWQVLHHRFFPSPKAVRSGDCRRFFMYCILFGWGDRKSQVILREMGVVRPSLSLIAKNKQYVPCASRKQYNVDDGNVPRKQ
jgi:hypothetical protein